MPRRIKTRKRNTRKKQRTKRKHRTRHIKGGHVDQETTKTLELVPIEESAMVAAPGFSGTVEEYEAMMKQLDEQGAE